MDDEPCLARSTPAASDDGREPATIEQPARAEGAEGITTPGGLHPLRAAFVEHDGVRCGCPTPGQVMSDAAAIPAGHAESAARARACRSGNPYRCAVYPQVVDAVMGARGRMAGGGVAREARHLGLLESAAGVVGESRAMEPVRHERPTSPAGDWRSAAGRTR